MIRRPPYTEQDRQRLLAPISITHFGGKSHAGSCASPKPFRGRGRPDEDNTSDRYAQAADWADLDNLK